jgi:hypothetical protein
MSFTTRSPVRDIKELDDLVGRVRGCLPAPDPTVCTSWREVEAVLAAGYGHAFCLEGEITRLARKIDSLAVEGGCEKLLTRLVARRRNAGIEMHKLRSLLTQLVSETRVRRVAAAVATRERDLVAAAA